MKNHTKAQDSSEISRKGFRTPKLLDSPRSSKTSKNTTSKRTGSPISSSARWKRRSLPSSTAQSTLTQIDFVAQNTHPDEEQLEYISDSAIKKTNLACKDEEPEDTVNRQPSRPLSGITTFERNNDHPKRRRQSLAPVSSTSKRRIQTSNPTTSSAGKRKPPSKFSSNLDNKTLTQIGFVKRFIPLNLDDDDNQYIPKAESSDISNEAKQEPASEKKFRPAAPTPKSIKHHRAYEGELDLSTGEPISDLGQSQSDNTDKPVDPLVTPKKPRKFEIPSSQSPESPGIAIITSSQFRSATRSPLKHKSPNITQKLESCINEESPSPQNSQGSGNMSPLQTPTPHSPKLHINSSQHPFLMVHSSNETPMSAKLSRGPSPHEKKSRSRSSQGSRVVVYETDGETDESDPGGYLSDDSRELPLPNVKSSAEVDSEHQSELPMSDSSVLYRRMHQATQFPHEPIPTLNTQGLSVLFATEDNSEYLEPLPLQYLTQNQEPDQTEFVPESSPREEQSNEEESQVAFQRPRVPDSVVQVESSQLVDPSYQQSRVLSRSQLVTSSMMDSVPLPQFWMGSQDSVGEPYSTDM